MVFLVFFSFAERSQIGVVRPFVEHKLYLFSVAVDAFAMLLKLLLGLEHLNARPGKPVATFIIEEDHAGKFVLPFGAARLLVRVPVAKA